MQHLSGGNEYGVNEEFRVARVLRSMLADQQTVTPDFDQFGPYAGIVRLIHESYSQEGSALVWDMMRAVALQYPVIAHRVLMGDIDPEQTEQPRRRFTEAHELGSLPKITYLVPDILQDRGINVCYGKSGVGKSFLWLLFAALVAEVGSVIYCAGEGLYGFHTRVEALEEADIEVPNGRLFFTSEVNLFVRQDVERFIAEAEAYQPRLIIFDTLSTCLVGASDNSNDDINLVYAHCRRIIEALDCAVLLVHHTGKQETDFRGAYTIKANADVLLCATEVDPETGYEALQLEVEKTKHAARPAPTVYELHVVKESLVPKVNDKLTRQAANGRMLTKDQRRILQLLNTRFVDGGASRGDILKAVDLPAAQVDKHLVSLRAQKLVDHAGKYSNYRISDEGKKAITPSIDCDLPDAA